MIIEHKKTWIIEFPQETPFNNIILIRDDLFTNKYRIRREEKINEWNTIDELILKHELIVGELRLFKEVVK